MAIPTTLFCSTLGYKPTYNPKPSTAWPIPIVPRPIGAYNPEWITPFHPTIEQARTTIKTGKLYGAYSDCYVDHTFNVPRLPALPKLPIRGFVSTVLALFGVI